MENTNRYSSYKETKLSWLGEVPSHWDKVRIKDLSRLASGNSIISEQIEPEGEYPVFGGNGIRGYYSDYTNEGDHILIGRQGALCGNINYANGRFWASEHAVVAYLRKGVHLKWYGEMLRTMNLNQYSISAAQPGLSVDRIKQLMLFIPPLKEQESIANYLDTQTARIDQKIDLLRKKAEKYADLKQALINETVTRGLDKSVPMKNSGVEWIGEVPEHWEVSSVTEMSSPVSIKNQPDEELLSVYRDYGVIIKSSRDDNHNKAGQNLASYKLVKPGFLVINKMKAWQGSLGVSAYQGIVSPAYITCKTDKKKIERRYLHHLLRSTNYIGEYNRLSYGIRVDQWDMRYDDFKYVPVLVPPRNEQKEIADYLDKKLSQIDEIVGTINSQIGNLQELRKTLINDVVTGKIKVA